MALGLQLNKIENLNHPQTKLIEIKAAPFQAFALAFLNAPEKVLFLEKQWLDKQKVAKAERVTKKKGLKINIRIDELYI